MQQDWSSSLAEKVFRVLEAAIRRGDMKPGNRVYDYNLATYDAADKFDHTASVGFIKVFGMGAKVSAAVDRKNGLG